MFGCRRHFFEPTQHLFVRRYYKSMTLDGFRCDNFSVIVKLYFILTFFKGN